MNTYLHPEVLKSLEFGHPLRQFLVKGEDFITLYQQKKYSSSPFSPAQCRQHLTL